MDRLPSVLGYDNERSLPQSCEQNTCNESDSQLISSNYTNDSIEDKDLPKSDVNRDGEDIDVKRTKLETIEEAVETDEVVTYTDSSTFLKVSFD